MLSIFAIIYSIIKSFLFLLLNRPKIIFGMGGYSSFPVCFAASILRIKFVIYESNLIIGKANKYLLPLSKKFLFLIMIWMEFLENTNIKLLKLEI